MFGIIDIAKLAIGAMAGAALFYPLGQWRGEAEGRAELKAEIASAALAVERERVKDDARLSGLSDYDLCVRHLEPRGMPVDACLQLRGVQTERP